MIGKSWWIKGDTIIPVDHHLEYLQEHPQQFGLTTNKLKTVIANAKAQGKDVKEDVIINYALVNGWIRVRKNPQYWSFNVRGFRQRRKDIVNFCYDMTMEKKMSENDSMKILDFTDGKTYNYYYQQGGVKAFLAESKKKGINPMKEKQEKSQKREARRIGGAWWFRGAWRQTVRGTDVRAGRRRHRRAT